MIKSSKKDKDDTRESNVYLGFPHLIVYGVDNDKWCEKYKLEPFIVTCSVCGSDILVNVPFIAKDRRGIVSEPCKCGDDNISFSYVDLNFDELNLNSLGGFTNVRCAINVKNKPCLRIVD